jgi:hypothetical protein
MYKLIVVEGEVFVKRKYIFPIFQLPFSIGLLNFLIANNKIKWRMDPGKWEICFWITSAC